MLKMTSTCCYWQSILLSVKDALTQASVLISLDSLWPVPIPGTNISAEFVELDASNLVSVLVSVSVSVLVLLSVPVSVSVMVLAHTRGYNVLVSLVWAKSEPLLSITVGNKSYASNII